MNVRVYKCTVYVFALLFTTTVTANTEEKLRDIYRLVEVMEMASMAEQMTEMIVIAILQKERQLNPKLPEEAEQVIAKTVHKMLMAQTKELFEMTVPLYDKYYTHAEIIDLVAFFNSPLGRKYSTVSTHMTADLYPIVQQWAARHAPSVARQVERDLSRHGYR